MLALTAGTCMHAEKSITPHCIYFLIKCVFHCSTGQRQVLGVPAQHADDSCGMLTPEVTFP